MASGTVGYTDTRGNRDYTSIIANQIGKRLKEASNMASEERAYAAGKAEAGGTSLEEAGIGKGYFFGRALGNRFGGDRISRTRGRMGASGPGTSPAASYKQRFRGGFDYNVTNQVQNITDTVPLSNAVVTGLRGVQTGLVAVASAISRQDSTMNSLANTQADMAKAIMFNGYLFQMFQSQQRQEAGRRSARREERSIEGGGIGYGGGIGGAGFGGAGGGRGMVNITPGAGGSGGGMGGGAGNKGGVNQAIGSFVTSTGLSVARGRSIAEIGARATGKGLEKTASGLFKSDVLGAMKAPNLNPGTVGRSISKFLETGGVGSRIFTQMLQGGTNSVSIVKGADQVAQTLALMGKSGTVSPAQANLLSLAYRMQDAGKGQMYSDLMDAMVKQKQYKQFKSIPKGLNAMQLGFDPEVMANIELDQRTFRALRGVDGKPLYNKKQIDIFQQLGLSPGAANISRFRDRTVNSMMKRGRYPGAMRAIGTSPSEIAENIARYYPGTKFKNLHEAITLTEFARLLDKGHKPREAVDMIRRMVGPELADEVLIKGGKTAMKNPMVAKSLSKVGGIGLLKRLPLIGAVLGAVFAIDRLRKGDFLGAGLELSSGLLGLTPATTGLGFGIDGFLLARDLGMTPMRTGGTIYPSRTNSMLSVGGRMFNFNEPGNKEVVRVEKDNEDRFVEQGIGIVEGMKKKKNDYVSLQATGVESALSGLKSGGFFGSMFDTVKDTVNTTKNILPNLNPLSGIKNWFNKGYSPKEDTMKWKDLLSDDWNQRGKFGKGGKLGGWDITRGFRPGVSAKEGGFMSGPTPAGRQAVKRGFGFLSSFRGGALTTMLSLIANDFINPQPLADGTMDGYMKSIGQNNSMQLQNENVNPIATTVINNNYYNGGGGSGGQESGNENLGQGFNDDLTKFITGFSIMSK